MLKVNIKITPHSFVGPELEGWLPTQRNDENSVYSHFIRLKYFLTSMNSATDEFRDTSAWSMNWNNPIIFGKIGQKVGIFFRDQIFSAFIPRRCSALSKEEELMSSKINVSIRNEEPIVSKTPRADLKASEVFVQFPKSLPPELQNGTHMKKIINFVKFPFSRWSSKWNERVEHKSFMTFNSSYFGDYL